MWVVVRLEEIQSPKCISHHNGGGCARDNDSYCRTIADCHVVPRGGCYLGLCGSKGNSIRMSTKVKSYGMINLQIYKSIAQEGHVPLYTTDNLPAHYHLDKPCPLGPARLRVTAMTPN